MYQKPQNTYDALLIVYDLNLVPRDDVEAGQVHAEMTELFNGAGEKTLAQLVRAVSERPSIVNLLRSPSHIEDGVVD